VPKLKFELHGKRFDMDSVLLEDVDVLKLFSAIVIATDHSVYKGMLDALCDLGQKLIDTRNLLGGVSNNNEKIVRL
jgi:UDP-N-acetyl-D-mannosaminuronate dehydrogenase